MSPMQDSDNDLFPDIARVMYTSADIAARVEELGAKISEDYRGRNLVLVSILKGGIVFLGDLMRAITVPHAFDLIGRRATRAPPPPAAR